MKHLLAALIIIPSIGFAEPTAKEIEEGCNTATHNVILAYKEAEKDTPITAMIGAYPEHTQEILAGYKLYGAGNSEYEAYVIFKDYCIGLFKRA